MDPFIFLSSPHMGGNETKYVNEAFESNWVAPLGPNVTNFEKDLEAYLGQKKYVAALNSGTAAIHLALRLLGVGRDDEVICQSLTFSASANPIIYQGAIPVFIDSEVSTWNMCPIHLEEAIKVRIEKGRKPKAIICVHLYGMPFQVEAIQKIANKYEIPLIEDAAEALGSEYEDQKCGTFGDFAILSFNGNKIITTSGGGALICKDESTRNRAVFLATQAKDDAPHYQHSEIGFNYRLSNICAGIGRGQMEVLDEYITKRRLMNVFYQELFKNAESISIFSDPSAKYKSNHWLTCIQIDSDKSGITPKDIFDKLLEKNIESRPLWKPMHLQPVFKDAPYYGTTVSENIFKKGLCLPSGSNISAKEKERITNALQSFSYI